ncbi:hypothetical protein CEXT_665471 [Caerostris extrusa]|uniref:Uncharacterized protein n=1 Tax=Caerostris extrusa TaxID=172846 RepID=A0AAV4USC7_CAEEX|nr:hypothetical protein CEXT_665471 [Caerostris extrusa]
MHSDDTPHSSQMDWPSAAVICETGLDPHDEDPDVDGMLTLDSTLGEVLVNLKLSLTVTEHCLQTRTEPPNYRECESNDVLSGLFCLLSTFLSAFLPLEQSARLVPGPLISKLDKSSSHYFRTDECYMEDPTMSTGRSEDA